MKHFMVTPMSTPIKIVRPTSTSTDSDGQDLVHSGLKGGTSGELVVTDSLSSSEPQHLRAPQGLKTKVTRGSVPVCRVCRRSSGSYHINYLCRYVVRSSPSSLSSPCLLVPWWLLEAWYRLVPSSYLIGLIIPVRGTVETCNVLHPHSLTLVLHPHSLTLVLHPHPSH